MSRTPRLLITLGDVAGIGPEVVVRAWPELVTFCRPLVVGDGNWIARTLELLDTRMDLAMIDSPAELPQSLSPNVVVAVQATDQPLGAVRHGVVDCRAGQAAFDFLAHAIDAALAGHADGIVTAPLHKEGLRAAGVPHPGHTEILAQRTGSRCHAMMLYGEGLAVVHATLHLALRDVVSNLNTQAVRERIVLLDAVLTPLLGRTPRIGVAALNPHAGDGGLFGDEEAGVIRPALDEARNVGLDASGPWPADTLFQRALAGEFDGIVAMYHDQGHIPMKLHFGMRLVNVTLGLPIIRTSVAHGTGYDIAGTGRADARSLVEAARLAQRLALCRG